MPNNILRLILEKDRGMLGELSLDLYEMQLLRYPLALEAWRKFTHLRNLFQ